MPAGFSQTAFAQLPPYPVNFTGDLLQVTQALAGINVNLSTWTLRVANALNLLIPGGGVVPVSQGGTGNSTLGANQVLTGNGTGPIISNTAWTIVGGGQILENNDNAAIIPAAITGQQVILQAADATICAISQVSYAAATSNIGWRAEGTGAMPTATGAGSVITQLACRGFDGTNWAASGIASIQLATINQTSSTDHSSKIVFNTVPTASLTSGVAATFTSQGCSLLGTNTNDSASAGQIGEYASAIVLIASEVSINSAANVVTLNLTAGDWDVSGELWVDTATGTATISGKTQAGITTSTGTLPTVPADATGKTTIDVAQLGTPAAPEFVLPVGPVRVSLSTATNVFLVGVCTVSAGTANGYGKLSARRRR